MNLSSSKKFRAGPRLSMIMTIEGAIIGRMRITMREMIILRRRVAAKISLSAIPMKRLEIDRKYICIEINRKETNSTHKAITTPTVSTYPPNQIPPRSPHSKPATSPKRTTTAIMNSP